MMARQHVTFAVGVSGTVLGATAYALPGVEQWVKDSPIEVGLMLMLIAGGALVPDMDHHSSTITVKLGWLGTLLHQLLKLMGVRHRGFLHTLWFALISGVVFLGIELLMPVWEWVVIALGLLLMFYASITLAFLFGKVGRNPLLIVGTSAALVYGYAEGIIGTSSHWLAIGAFAGPLLHDFGDKLTKERFAMLYPLTKRDKVAALGFKTSGWLETGPLRAVFGAWATLAFAWVGLLSAGLVTRTDVVAMAQSGDAGQWAAAAPYLLWTLTL